VKPAIGIGHGLLAGDELEDAVTGAGETLALRDI
jgi:hypothetical protein